MAHGYGGFDIYESSLYEKEVISINFLLQHTTRTTPDVANEELLQVLFPPRSDTAKETYIWGYQ